MVVGGGAAVERPRPASQHVVLLQVGGPLRVLLVVLVLLLFPRRLGVPSEARVQLGPGGRGIRGPGRDREVRGGGGGVGSIDLAERSS